MTSKRHEDRRIRRTRQALQQAFIEVVREKGLTMTNWREIERCFAAISIQEITDRANVNRGTFYLHFTDKYMLVDAITRERFHQQLVSVLPSDPQWDKKTVYLLTQTVLHIFEGKYHHQHQPAPVLSPTVEGAIHEELTDLLVTWLKKTRGTRKQSDETLETIARVVSWAIFGTAIQWSQEEISVSLNEMAESISQVITEGVARLAPETLPE